MRVLGTCRSNGLALVIGLSLAMVASDAMSQSYGSWGSSGSYGSYGSSASYGSYGSSASYGSYGRVGIIGRMRARRAARWSSYGSSGSSGSSASYGSYGSSGSSGGYASYSSAGSSGSYGSVSPSGSYIETTAAASTGDASIKVSLPADAKVFVNDALTTSTGTERSYVSRGLREGMTYSYAIRVEYEKEGKTVSEDEIVKLAAGKTVKLSFGKSEDASASAATDAEVKTQVKVAVPADAKVFLSGSPTQQTGGTRTYTTTELAPGQQWEGYTVRVEWDQNGETLVREEQLTVTGGETYELAFDFESTAPAQLAQLVK
jgi:uncharacterized protein (TIGR03000 family)